MCFTDVTDVSAMLQHPPGMFHGRFTCFSVFHANDVPKSRAGGGGRWRAWNIITGRRGPLLECAVSQCGNNSHFGNPSNKGCQRPTDGAVRLLLHICTVSMWESWGRDADRCSNAQLQYGAGVSKMVQGHKCVYVLAVMPKIGVTPCAKMVQRGQSGPERPKCGPKCATILS